METADSGTLVSCAVVQPQLHHAVLEPEQRALEAAAALDRLGGLQAGQMARPADVILGPRQRPVDAGRAHFEGVGARDRILDIEHRRERARKHGAGLDIHRPAVGRLDHDLQRAALAHGDAHQLVAHADDGRGDDVFDATQQFGHAGLFSTIVGLRASHKMKRAGFRPTLCYLVRPANPMRMARI